LRKKKKGLVWLLVFGEERKREESENFNNWCEKRNREIQMIDFRRCCVCFVIYKVVVSLI
jgi:hypothetical protein